MRETAGLWHAHVVSLLVIGKAGHLDFETETWWHISADRTSCSSAHFCADHVTKWYKISSSKTTDILPNCAALQFRTFEIVLQLRKVLKVESNSQKVHIIIDGESLYFKSITWSTDQQQFFKSISAWQIPVIVRLVSTVTTGFLF